MALLSNDMIDEIRQVATRYSEREYERRRQLVRDARAARGRGAHAAPTEEAVRTR